MRASGGTTALRALGRLAYAVLVALAGAVSVGMLGGCVALRAAYGQAVVEAGSVSDELVLDASHPHMYPPRNMVVPVNRVIVIPYYEWPRSGGPRVEFLKPCSLPPRRGRVEFPMRYYWAMHVPGEGSSDAPFGSAAELSQEDSRSPAEPVEKALAFADGCWPALVGVGGLLTFRDVEEGKAAGADVMLRCMFLRRTRPFDQYAWCELGLRGVRPPLLRVLPGRVNELIKALERSALAPEERAMVYAQLADVAEQALGRRQELKQANVSIDAEAMTQALEALRRAEARLAGGRSGR